MAKKIHMSFEVRLPKDHKAVRANITPEGMLRFFDAEGNVIEPLSTSRDLYYDRKKGPKIQTRIDIASDWVSIGGLRELSGYESIFVVDTNTTYWNSEKVSVASFIRVQVIPEGDTYRIVAGEGAVHFYEFRGIVSNPELLSVLKIANDVIRCTIADTNLKFAIVTDSALGNHKDINNRVQPIHNDYYLPDAFIILYASADTGQEAANRLIRFCDRQATDYLQRLQKGEFDHVPLRPLDFDNSVSYRYLSRSGLELENPVVRGPALQPGTTVELYGWKEPGD